MSGTTHPPPQIVYLNRPQRPRVPYTVKYTGHNLTTVKWISGLQMFIAVLCLILQVTTLIFIGEWMTEESRLRSQFVGDVEVYLSLSSADGAGTGVWGGILMIITAAVGIASWRQNRKGLVVTYLVLSVIIIPISIALIGTSSASLDRLQYCRQYGIYTRIHDYSGYNWYYNQHESENNKPQSLYFFGESLGKAEDTNDFYCRHPMFGAWMAMDAFMILSAVMIFILSLLSLVYSSKAACGGCCRQCCSCCEPGEDMVAVTYPQIWSNQPPARHVHIQASTAQLPVSGVVDATGVQLSVNQNDMNEEGKSRSPPAYTSNNA